MTRIITDSRFAGTEDDQQRGMEKEHIRDAQ
jgi:hypothetical protein